MQIISHIHHINMQLVILVPDFDWEAEWILTCSKILLHDN
jgi:hypothetical protein